MAFMDEIPAQRMALDYLTAMGKDAREITVCGHSKGGNLTLYAACACAYNIQEKIGLAVSFDGPGLNQRMVRSEGFARMRDRMRVVLPRSSLVGMLFEQPENVRIVDSRSFSALQHYPYFWKTAGMDFIYLARPGKPAALLGKTVCGLMEKLSADAREQLVEAVFGILSASDADTFNDMADSWLKSAAAIAAGLFQTDAQTRRVFLSAAQAILSAAADALRETARSG